MRVTVADDGIGMSEDQLAMLFQPFTQVDESATRRFGGTGLGLSISRRLAQMLGGDIAVSSEFGKGSTFTVTTDGGPVEASGAESGGSPPFADREIRPAQHAASVRRQLTGRVLLVEDGKDNQRLATAYLQQAGVEVVIADNGRVAVQRMRQSRSGPSFDLILMDIQMPEMDGYTATRLIREDGFALPIIALTAHALPCDREKALHCGCNDLLTKPIEGTALIACLAAFLPAAPTSPIEDPAPSTESRNAPLRSTRANDDVIKTILGQYVECLPTLVGDMIRRLESADFDALNTVVHQLKGSGGGSLKLARIPSNVGATAAKPSAFAVQVTMKDWPPPGNITCRCINWWAMPGNRTWYSITIPLFAPKL